MAVSPGWVSWMHSNADRADRGRTVLQVDDGLAALRQDIERGAAHADGRQRRRDLVGGLVRMAGDETERARRHAHRDFAIVMLVVEDGAVELERRVGSEREVGAVGHHQPRCAVGAGAHGFVAHQSVADIDLGGRRSGNAEHFILDDGGFADARLRVRSGLAASDRPIAEAASKKKAVTQIHFKADRSIPTSYRIARASDVAELSQAAPYWPVG